MKWLSVFGTWGITKWIVLSLIVAVIGSFAWHENKAVDTAKNEVIKEYASEALEQRVEAYKAEVDLGRVKGIADEVLIKEQKSIIAHRDDVIRSLQLRPSRKDPKEADTTTPQAPSACKGTELYSEDGGFLIGEAARADKLIAERDYYYGRYEDARLQLERLNGKD